MRATPLMALAVFCASPALAQSRFELETRLWQPDLTSSVRSIEGVEGIDPVLAVVDLQTDLGMQDDDFLDYRLTVHTGPRSRVRLGFISIQYEGDSEILRTITFRGETYELGTRVISDLSMDYYRAGWVWEFLGTERARLGTIVEAKAVEVDAGLLAPELDPMVDERDSLSAVFPTIGLAVDLNPSRRINLFAEASGIDGVGDGRFLDAEAGVRIMPLPFLTVIGGWRLIDLEIEDGQDFAKLKDEGPFFGLLLRF